MFRHFLAVSKKKDGLTHVWPFKQCFVGTCVGCCLKVVLKIIRLDYLTHRLAVPVTKVSRVHIKQVDFPTLVIKSTKLV